MSVRNLRNLEQRFLTDHKLSADEAKKLVDSTHDWFGVSKAEKNELKAILQRYQDKLEPAARQVIEDFLGIAPSRDEVNPASGQAVRTLPGPNPSSFDDDVVFFGADGRLSGESGVPAYTRSYDATKEGPLRQRHGSEAPASQVLSASEQSQVRSQTPGQALDAAAKVFGVSVDGFDKLANSKDFFNPDADYWWGKCHAWTWSSLDKRIDALVDVGGPEGEKGVWIGGQWLSRADLGNWMMAVSDTISLHDPQEMFDSSITAADLVKGTTQFMMNNGGGAVLDIFNDQKHGHREVWNQPFVAADLQTTSVSGDAAAQLIALAKKDGVQGGVAVKQVNITGTYGVEISDDHEGAPGRSEKNWNLYAVVDANGKMLTAYMADDEKLKGISGLPTTTTDESPEYFWRPKLQAIDDVLAGRRNGNVEGDAHGREFKFFVGTVLTRGVPGPMRAAFERELAALPAGRIDAEKAAELAKRYAQVANAYSPAQWASAFGARGLEAKAFGAAWNG